MAHYPALHCAKIGITFTHNVEAIRCENTLYVRDTTDNLFSDPVGFTTQVFGAVTAHLPAVHVPEVIFDGVTYEDIRSIPYGGGDFPQTPTPGTAGAGTMPMPTSSAFSFKKNTGAVGRSYRGRWYYPVWDGSLLSAADTMFALNANNIVTALAAMQAAIEGGTYPCEVGIVSFQFNKLPRNPGVFTQITSWSYTDLLVDNQRRRLLGRGR